MGESRLYRRGQLAPPFAQFEEAAFSLRKRGEISEVVRTPYGYHIIQVGRHAGEHLEAPESSQRKDPLFPADEKKAGGLSSNM